MNKQPQRPLGIFLEGPGRPSRSTPRLGLWLVLFLVLFVALGLFFGHPIRKWEGLFHHPPRAAEASRTPISQVLAKRAVPAAPEGAPSLPPVTAPPLPAEVTLSQAVSLTVTRNGRVAGVIHLQPGQRVKPLSLNGTMLNVAYGDATGPVPIAATDYNPPAAETNEPRESTR